MKITYLGKPIGVKQPRVKGRYSSFGKWETFKKNALRAVIVCSLGVICYGSYSLGEFDERRTLVAYAESGTSTVIAEIKGKSIEQLKDEVIAELSKCENPEQNEGIVVYDQNSKKTLKGQNIASIGLMQFKIPTIQYYWEKLHGQKLSDKEAVMLAVDGEGSKAFAKEVIFGISDGIGNWTCATTQMKLKVEIIREMEGV